MVNFDSSLSGQVVTFDMELPLATKSSIFLLRLSKWRVMILLPLTFQRVLQMRV